MSTFRTAADLCEAFDGFVFNHNEAVLYQWVEEYEPALFERIRALAAAGKWHIMGGWYLQPDCNMPSGESFVRQVLAGRRYFHERFGVTPTTAINFDPFGHSRGIAQILAKSGYDSYLFCRPGPNECALPDDEFIWKGFDGSTVLARRVTNGYNSPLGKARNKVEHMLTDLGERDNILVLWGVGNHGGGPSHRDLAELAALIEERTDLDVRHSTPEAYFRHLAGRRDSLPVHADDMNPWAVGCYSSQIRIKQLHRELENSLFVTENMLTTAAANGLLDYPDEELHDAQKDLLFNEFHDILPGSSIQPVEDASLRSMNHGLEILSRLRARAFFTLAQGQPKPAEDHIPILVYNPHPVAVAHTVECEFQLADQNWEDSFTVPTVMAGDDELPCQVEKELSNLNLDWRKRVVFDAKLAPGMNRFDCRLQRVAERPAPHVETSNGQVRVETDELIVAVNTGTGLVDEFTVKTAGTKSLLAPGACRPLVIRDDEDPWGMRVRAFRDVTGEFTLMSPEEGARFSGLDKAALPSVHVVEDGPVRTVVESLFSYANSGICMQVRIPKRGAAVELAVRVIWGEKNRMLKLALPLAFHARRFCGETAYGVQDLPGNGDEAVAQRWIAVHGPDPHRALGVVNNGTYASDCANDELRLTLLRSPAYSGHPIKDRPVVPQDRFLPRHDQGERVFRFWLTGAPAQTPDRSFTAHLARTALTANQPPMALSFFPSGLGARPKPFIVLSNPDVLLTALKRAEDGDATIVRLFEPTGEDTRTVTADLPALETRFTTSLTPFEIKTFRIDNASGRVTEADLLEKPL
jgi:alpha-mannosidase